MMHISVIRLARIALAPLLFQPLLSALAQDELDFLVDTPAHERGAEGREDTADRNSPTTDVVDTVNVEPLREAEQAPATRAQSASRLVEEIVVTAQKREEMIQDVPISIQAFTADALDVQGVLDIQSLPQITPGLTVTTQVAYTSTYIRGVGSDAFLLADPSVATYYDGIYQPFPNGLVQDFGVIDRVEILKGPQGTLFGRNAVGGAINIITRAPNLEDFELALQTAYETHSTTRNRAYISIPLGGRLALSVAGIYNSGEYHVKGTAAGKPLPEITAEGGRAQLRFLPFDWMELLITGFQIENHGPTTSYTPNTAPSSVFGAAITPQDPYAGAVNEDLFYDHKNKTIYGQLTLFTRAFDIKLLGSDQDTRSSFNYDFDSSPTPLALFQIDNVFAEVQTAELQFLSNQSSWGSSRLKWILGGYFFQSRTGFDPSFLRVGATNLAEGILLDQEIPGLAALVNGLLGTQMVPTGDINFFGLLGTQSIAGFAQATVEVTDTLALTLGGRYQKEERKLIRSSSELRTLDGGLITIQDYRAGETPVTMGGVPSPNSGPELIDITESFDPKISIDFRPRWSWLGDEPLLYASWQTATKSSTYNTVNIYDPPDLVRPEDITAYEIGIKTNLFDRLMRFNLAVFDYQIKDQQVQFISLLAGGAVTFENAGTVAVTGIEFDVLTQLFPSLVSDLVLTTGAAIIDARYESFTDGSGFTDQGVLTQNNDFSGNQVVRSPDVTGYVGLSKTFLTGIGPLEIGANYYYNSGFYYSAQNSRNAEEDAYDLLNARVSLLIERWSLRLSVYGQNILDEEYSYSKFPSDFGVGDARAPKSIYGARLQFQF